MPSLIAAITGSQHTEPKLKASPVSKKSVVTAQKCSMQISFSKP